MGEVYNSLKYQPLWKPLSIKYVHLVWCSHFYSLCHTNTW